MDDVPSTKAAPSDHAPGPIPDSGDHASIVSALSTLDQLIEAESSQPSPHATIADFVLTEDRIVAEAERLQHAELNPDLASWVARYGQVGDRSEYLWTWCRQGIHLTTLPCVSAEIRDDVCDTKLLGVMFDVLVDDVADQGGDPRLLERLIQATNLGHLNTLASVDPLYFSHRQRTYLAFSESVWNDVQRRVQCFPRYQQFADLLRFDYQQLVNAMHYSHLLNRFPSLLNLAEHDLYLPHNMHMMVSATMDLMCSPGFDLNEIGRLREAVWHAQYMGRIGNLVTTWERELYEGDFTSGVFAHAVIDGELSIKTLIDGDRGEVESIIRRGQHEEHFMRQWQQHRKQLVALTRSLHSVDLRPLVEGLERLICLHLASRGSK